MRYLVLVVRSIQGFLISHSASPRGPQIPHIPQIRMMRPIPESRWKRRGWKNSGENAILAILFLFALFAKYRSGA